MHPSTLMAQTASPLDSIAIRYFGGKATSASLPDHFPLMVSPIDLTLSPVSLHLPGKGEALRLLPDVAVLFYYV
jgi:hypothetical protein